MKLLVVFLWVLPLIKAFEWPTLTYKPRRLCSSNETYDPSMLICEICNGPNTIPDQTGKPKKSLENHIKRSFIYLLKRVKNSDLVLGLSRNSPSMQLVTVWLVVFCTPRITMHICEASMTTPTPAGSTAALTASAISFVNRSWTWSLRA